MAPGLYVNRSSPAPGPSWGTALASGRRVPVAGTTQAPSPRAAVGYRAGGGSDRYLRGHVSVARRGERAVAADGQECVDAALGEFHEGGGASS